MFRCAPIQLDLIHVTVWQAFGLMKMDGSVMVSIMSKYYLFFMGIVLSYYHHDIVLC